MKRGEIWTAAGGESLSKPRPVVIVQSDTFDTDSVTVCPFTSDLSDAVLVRVPVEPNGVNGLRKDSRIMVDKIQSTTRAKLGERLGELTPEQMIQVGRSLVVFLGIAS